MKRLALRHTLGFWWLIVLATAAAGDQSSEIDRLIRQLGSPRFKERQAASRRLAGLGDAAVDALSRAAANHRDPEVRHRAQALLNQPPPNHRARATLIGHTESVMAVAFSPDGKTLASGGMDWTVRLWNKDAAEATAVLRGHDIFVNTVAFSPDGKLLASGDVRGVIKLWDVAARRERATLEGHTGSVRSVAFSPDGKVLASGSQDDTVRLWQMPGGKSLGLLRKHQVVSAALSPDGKYLAAGPTIWDVEGWKNHGSVEDSKAPDAIAFSHDGRLLALAETEDVGGPVAAAWERSILRTKIVIWDVDKSRVRATLGGQRGTVYCVAFSPDGQMLASAESDSTVKFWSVKTGKWVRTLAGHSSEVHSVCFSPDGRWAATASEDKTVKLWDVLRLP